MNVIAGVFFFHVVGEIEADGKLFVVDCLVDPRRVSVNGCGHGFLEIVVVFEFFYYVFEDVVVETVVFVFLVGRSRLRGVGDFFSGTGGWR